MEKLKGPVPLSAFYVLTLGTLLLLVIWGSRAVSVISENMPVSRSCCYVIDPGHGGIDGGATSCTGILESKFNLDISLKLNDLLHFLGYETKMIRSGDYSVYTEGSTIAAQKVSDLKERLRIANSTENAVYVSIHQNYFSDSRYYGPQIFCADTPGSAELARLLQANLNAMLAPESNRQSKLGQGIYLLERIKCTGILIECGFISNPKDEALLRNPDYQNKLCGIIAFCLIDSSSKTEHA